MSVIDPECKRIDQLREGSSPHIVLGIPEDSDENVKNNAYRKLALKCHPDRPTNTDKELFTSIFQKITAANEALNASKGVTTSHDIRNSPHPLKTYDESRKHFGHIAPENDKYIKDLEKWLEECVLFFFDIPNILFDDINKILHDVDIFCAPYESNPIIGPLYYEISASAIWNMLHNKRSLTYDEQLWIATKLAYYIQLTRAKLRSPEYDEIIMSKKLEERLTDPEIMKKNRYIMINEFKDFVKKKQKKQKLADDEGETRIAVLRTMVDTFILNRTKQNENSLNKFIQDNIYEIFNFLPKEKQTEIEELIQKANKQSKSGGFSVRSNRKQSKRRLRKTRHRRKKITKKSKQV